MSLRARLLVFFIAIVVVPLALAGLLIRGAIGGEVNRRTDIRLQGDLQALQAALRSQSQSTSLQAGQAINEIAQMFSRLSPPTTDQVTHALEEARSRFGLDYLVVAWPDHRLTGLADPGHFLTPGFAMTPSEVVEAGPLQSLLFATDVTVERGAAEVAHLYAGRYLDQTEAISLSRLSGGIQFEALVGGKVAVSSLTSPVALSGRRPGTFEVSPGRRALLTGFQLRSSVRGMSLGVVRPLDGDVRSLQDVILFIVAGAVLVASVLGYRLAHLISEPIRRLADEATAAVSSRDRSGTAQPPTNEVAALATSFSTMSEHLQEAERLSVTDALTGVGNRRFLEATLAREIERARRYGRGLAVLMADIDHFKRVNDHQGHERGDRVLVEVCRRIEESVRREIDIVVRYGGEEFVILLPETDEVGAMAAAERMRLKVAGRPFGEATGDKLLNLSISVGVAVYPVDGATAEGLVRVADYTMYQAKRLGRNRVLSARTDRTTIVLEDTTLPSTP